MPYYDIGLAAAGVVNQQQYTTNVAGNTLTDHILGIAAATFGFTLAQLSFGSTSNFATNGPCSVRVGTGGTSAAGTAATASKRDPNDSAANSTWSTAITQAGNPVCRTFVAGQQFGGQNAELAFSPASAIRCSAGTGNKMEFLSIATTASVPISIAPVIAEAGGS